MRALAAIKADMLFQYRHGFYAVYFLITVFYIVLLRLLPPEPGTFLAPVLLFTDPAVLGFFFVGGLVLFERKQNLLEGFLVTPLRPGEYLLAKALSLSLISLGTSLAIAWLGVRVPFNPLLLLTGVSLTAPIFTLVGFTLAVRSRTLNSFILVSFLLTPVFVFPLAEYFGLFTHPLLYLAPGRGGMLLLVGSFRGISPTDAALSTLSLAFWVVLAFLWAKKSFYRYVVERGMVSW
ncbi:MAG: ABC transporter permease [Bacillota bacterium]|nr:ABC transporter permease [Bacillota bacterium]